MFGIKKLKNKVAYLETELKLAHKYIRNNSNSNKIQYLVVYEGAMGRTQYMKSVKLDEVVKLILDKMQLEVKEADVSVSEIQPTLVKKEEGKK